MKNTLSDFICMKALGLFYASCGGMMLVQFPSYNHSEVVFEANAISTTGTVVKTREESKCSGGVIVAVTCSSNYISTVEFQNLQGEPIEFTTSGACSSERDCTLKTVRVEYDPSVPQQARLYSDTALNVRVLGYGLFGLFFFLLGIWLLIIDLGYSARSD